MRSAVYYNEFSFPFLRVARLIVKWRPHKDIYRIDWEQPRHRIPSARLLEMLIYSEEFNLAHSLSGRCPAGIKPRGIRYSDRVCSRALWTREYIKSKCDLLTFAQLNCKGLPKNFNFWGGRFYIFKWRGGPRKKSTAGRKSCRTKPESDAFFSPWNRILLKTSNDTVIVFQVTVFLTLDTLY